MAFALADPAVREQIHADLLAAFPSLTAIHDSAPFVPASGASLPLAFVLLPNIDLEQGPASVMQGSAYEVTYFAAWPAEGSIQAAQIAAAQSLLDRIAARRTYAGENYELSDLALGDGQDQAGEPYFSFTLKFRVDADTPATYES